MADITISESIDADSIVELINQYGAPYTYKEHSYLLYKPTEQIITIDFESVKAEIKFWHLINTRIEIS